MRVTIQSTPLHELLYRLSRRYRAYLAVKAILWTSKGETTNAN